MALYRYCYRHLIALSLLFVLYTAFPAFAGTLDFSVVFTDGENLEPGSAVIYKGVHIGAVRSIDFDDEGDVEVKIRIKNKYRKQLYREALFVIENQGSSGGGSKSVQLIVKDQETPNKTRIQKGDRIFVDSTWSIKLDRVAEKISTWFNRNRHRFWDESKLFSESPEGVELRASMHQLAEQARTSSRKQLDLFMDDEYPKLLEQAKDLRDQFEQDGYKEEAEDFWAGFREWSEEFVDQTKKEDSKSKK